MTFASSKFAIYTIQECFPSEFHIEILLFHTRILFVIYIILRTVMTPTRELKKDMFAMFRGLYILEPDVLEM